MVYAIYIAAAAAVGLLIGFVVLSIGWLRKTVSRNIRSKTLGLLSVYDELLEKKSRDLAARAAVSEETPGRTDSPVGQGPVTAAQLSAPPSLRASELLDMAERSGGAVYRDREIGGLYLKIRENFSFRLDELLTVLDCSPREWGGPASRLLEQLDYDTVYRLSTISAEEQIQVLKEALPAENATRSSYKIGDIFYWTPKNALVIYYGQNGKSFDNLQKVGHIETDVQFLEKVPEIPVSFLSR